LTDSWPSPACGYAKSSCSASNVNYDASRIDYDPVTDEKRHDAGSLLSRRSRSLLHEATTSTSRVSKATGAPNASRSRLHHQRARDPTRLRRAIVATLPATRRRPKFESRVDTTRSATAGNSIRLPVVSPRLVNTTMGLFCWVRWRHRVLSACSLQGKSLCNIELANDSVIT